MHKLHPLKFSKYAERLDEYNYEIKVIPGTKNFSDWFSRFTANNRSKFENDEEKEKFLKIRQSNIVLTTTGDDGWLCNETKIDFAEEFRRDKFFLAF